MDNILLKHNAESLDTLVSNIEDTKAMLDAHEVNYEHVTECNGYGFITTFKLYGRHKEQSDNYSS